MYYLYVALFGAFGAVIRYWISSIAGSGIFPYNTLLINIAGCFLLSMVIAYLAVLPKFSKNLIAGIGTGFLGSFTTFSAFSAEVWQMIAGGHVFSAACYAAASLTGGFLAAGLGVYVSVRLVRRKELTGHDD